MSQSLESAETLSPVHPGEVLREEFMIPMRLTAGKIAKAIGVPRNRIEMIKREELTSRQWRNATKAMPVRMVELLAVLGA